MKRYAFISAPVLAFLLAACSGDSTSPSSVSFNLSAEDTAQAAALSASDATSEDVDVMLASDVSMSAGALTASADFAHTAAPSFSTVSADEPRVGFWSYTGGCTFNASSGRFSCPPQTNGGLTLNRSFAFFDASGKPMSAYNDTLTASADFQLSVSGVRLVSDGADTVSRQRDMTASGLLGHETSRTWNGNGSRTDGGYHTDSSAKRTYHTTDNTTFTNIVVKLPRSTYLFPMSGSITRQIAGSGSVTRNGTTKTFTLSRTVTITFNGTRYVPMMVGTTAYTLDLETGKATKS